MSSLQKEVSMRTPFVIIERDLAPKLMPFDGKNPRSVVLMDNVKFHHCTEVLAAIEGTGALVHFLPPS